MINNKNDMFVLNPHSYDHMKVDKNVLKYEIYEFIEE